MNNFIAFGIISAQELILIFFFTQKSLMQYLSIFAHNQNKSINYKNKIHGLINNDM